MGALSAGEHKSGGFREGLGKPWDVEVEAQGQKQHRQEAAKRGGRQIVPQDRQGRSGGLGRSERSWLIWGGKLSLRGGGGH
jgi:hypothetical protein